MTDMQHLLEMAKHAALDAGKAVMDIYQSGEFETGTKADASPVTKADRKSHIIITGHLEKTHLPILSEEGGNSDFEKRKQWKYCWFVDPLDGTKEFINKNGEFTINIGLVLQNVPVGGVIYVPCSDTLYSGSKETGVSKNEKGKTVEFPVLAERTQFKDLLQRGHITVAVSRSHMNSETKTFVDQFQSVKVLSLGSSLKFMSLLENNAAIYPRLGSTMEWDTAAAHAILNASNRGVYRADMRSELSYNKPDLTNPFFIAF